MAEFYNILTVIGQNKIAAAAAGGPLVNITHMAVGDGGGAYYDPVATQTALRAEKWRGSVSNVSIDPTRNNWVVVDATVPTEAGGFTIREAGVYDSAGDLIAIGKYPATYKPAPTEGSAKDLFLRMILAISNTSAVTFTIDPAVTLVTRPEYNQFTARFNTISRKDVTLQPGLQVIQAAKSSPFSLTELTGRMLVNLLGRYGGCETLGPWEANVSLLQDTTQRTSGMASFKLTVGAVDAYAGITFNCTPDHYYVILADVKAPAGGVAILSVQGLASSGSSVANGAFTTHIIRVKANAFFHQARVTFSGSSGLVFNLDSVRVYEVSEAEYNALGSMPVPERVAKYPYVDSVKPVRNPYAIRWTDDSRTDIAAMLALQTDLYADPLTGANADSVFERDGQYLKSKHWQRTILDDRQGWLYAASASGPGYKCVYYVHGASAVERSAKGVKYDGKILPDFENIQAPDKVTIDGVSAFVFIPNADSGWGDNHSPSQDEIKAYFLGWTMFNGSASGTGTITPDNPANNLYNGSGTRYWARRPDGISRSSWQDGTATLPTTQAPNWTPYELVYQLATPTVEPIVSEGQLTLLEGSNQIEVGTGIVLHEDAKPRLGTNWDINGNLSSLKYKVSRYINVYANSRLFFKAAHWVGVGNGPALSITPSDYDPSAVYSVTYLMLDTSPVAAFVGSVPDNEKSLLADLVQGVQEASTRVSVLENKKAEKDSPAWITPSTLLGGWTGSFNFGYRIEGNRVYFRGALVPGTATQGQVLFILPAQFRTKRSFSATFGQYSSTSGDTNVAMIDFYSDGVVRIFSAVADRIVFEGFSYSID